MRTGSRPFVLASTEHGPLIVSRLDRARGSFGEYGVGYQLLETGAYDPEDISTILGLLRDLRNERSGKLVTVDCGANIGVITLEMARLMQGWGDVIAFEAQEWLFYALCGNITLANAFNVTARFAAVGASRGMLNTPRVNYRQPGSYGSLELQMRPETEYIGQAVSYEPADMAAIQMVSIDSLTLPRLDFMKIDVEGMELDILKGAELALESYKPVLWIEWVKSDRPMMEDFLRSKGYTEISEFGMNILARAK